MATTDPTSTTVRLLLRDPSQAIRWPDELLADLDDPESGLLRQLAAELRRQPVRSVAALLGSWHGSPEGEALGAIAAADSLAPAGDSQLEADALLHRLRQRALDARVDRLSRDLQQSPSRETLQALTELKRQQTELMRDRPGPGDA
ncbi:hypothetical protein [Amnimonas aquatica]|uniref:DNA primase DnaG DnaB-binding domain-containing protein n=1 Tax=Amnimonas aquatica TaxID=2094561 RepID=A0A2P6ATW6_9GAMM|nr:hypothetical protein C5O18_03105 [Amnimonas aquatica]